jgi:cytochrome c556
MKTTIIVLAALVAATCWAQDDAAHQKLMKDAGATNAKIRKALEAKENETAVKEAQHLSSLFDDMVKYYKAKGIEDGVKFSETGSAAAKDVAASAGTGTVEDLAPKLKAVGASCGGCHTAHREKNADGTYKFK